MQNQGKKFDKFPPKNQFGSDIAESAFGAVTALLGKGAADGLFPGAVLIIGYNGQTIYSKSFGVRSVLQDKEEATSPMTLDTVFDIGTLTSSVVTITLLMKLLQERKVHLDDRISRYIQGFSVLGKSSITIEQVLSHTAGLAPSHPFYEELVRQNSGSRVGIMMSRGAREFVYNLIHRAPLRYTPGSKQQYSDLGMILLGELVEVLSGTTLDKIAQRSVFHPLGMRSTSYVDLSMVKRRGIIPVKEVIAPSEYCSVRGRLLCGEVSDENAWAMGGIAGHSGVFSTAGDLHAFARELVLAFQGRSSFLGRDVVRTFWGYKTSVSWGSWRLGWESPSEENGLSGGRLTASSIGHQSTTGCSIWIEPEKGLDVVFLTNCPRERSDRKLGAFRPELHNAIIEGFDKS